MTRPYRMIPVLLIAAAATLAAVSTAKAQEVRVYDRGEAVDPQEVARILAPSIKYRSLKLLDEPGAAAVQPARSGPAALALPIQFGFDSADVLPQTRPQLDALAAGIRLLPASQSVVIEGHTDAVGSEAYNESLSSKRAETVKRYLVGATGIAPQRLRVVALGKTEPLPGRDPLAPENRRVQFRGE